MTIKLDSSGIFEFENVDDAVDFYVAINAKVKSMNKSVKIKITKTEPVKKKPLKTGRFSVAEEAEIHKTYEAFFTKNSDRSRISSDKLNELAKRLNREKIKVIRNAYYMKL